jgi:hypothetical protein
VAACEPGNNRIELRVARRVPIIQRCFVYPDGKPPTEAWRCIAYNISATGVGVTLPVWLPAGTVLTIEAWGLPIACPLRARVVQSRQLQFFWFTGCMMLKRLPNDDFHAWRSGRLDWLDVPGQ